jgi:hypothetical protein
LIRQFQGLLRRGFPKIPAMFTRKGFNAFARPGESNALVTEIDFFFYTSRRVPGLLKGDFGLVGLPDFPIE